MRKIHRYVDAVRLLNGTDPLIKTLDTLFSVGTLGAWDLIDAKSDLIRVGNDLLGRWRDWRTGQEWRSRTERIEAAHTILVITAFVEALDGLKVPLKHKDPEISNGAKILLSSPVCPSSDLPFEDAKRSIWKHYTELGSQLAESIQGLASWERLSEPQRDRVSVSLRSTLASQAISLYEDNYRRLAVDVPEFALWAGMVDHQATRAGLAELERILLLTTSNKALPAQLETLARVQRAALNRAIAETGAVPIGMQLPTLDEAYLSPRFRAAALDLNGNPSQESWWQHAKTRSDLPRFLASYLTTSTASRVPLVVLGQPGAGKSVLTKVLAARLPSDFMPIRVPLRDVAANSSIQEQIEQAIYKLSAERLDWPAFARAAEGSLPVVMLDGFDELLQATDVRQTDYLTKVAEFQQRETDAGRAVAFIVTSRTAVADRAQFPQGTTVVRLEPFSAAQIRQWADLWNSKNAAFFRTVYLKQFTHEVALAQRELAEQPLLLLMLALYDADGNSLHKTVETLSKAQLYERLISKFAERELEKNHTRDQVPTLVERELLRLSFVAFSMFNRGRQWATAEEVSADLTVLLPQTRREATFDTPLSPADQVLGRFFFVHEAQATRDGDVLRTYEFLHATFGEFLIARLISQLMSSMRAQEIASMGFSLSAKDHMLEALLSYATLSTRTPLLIFLREIANSLTATESRELRELAISLFRSLEIDDRPSNSQYRPVRMGIPARYANYSANLLLLALTYSDGLLVSELFPQIDCVASWRRYALLWRSQCSSEDWRSLIALIDIAPIYLGPNPIDRDMQLQITFASRQPDLADIRWMLDDSRPELQLGGLFEHGTSWQAEVSSATIFLAQADDALVAHSISPLLTDELAWTIYSLFSSPGPPSSPTNILLSLLSLPTKDLSPSVRDRRRDAYRRAMVLLTYADIGRVEELMTKAFTGDLAALPDSYAIELIQRLAAETWASIAFLRRIAATRRISDRIIWPSRNGS